MKTKYQELIEELGRVLAEDFKKDQKDGLIDEDQDIGDWLIQSTQLNKDVTDAIFKAIN